MIFKLRTLLALGIFAVVTAQTDANNETICQATQLPFNGECSGFGTCVSGHCVCNAGYSGLGIWFDLSSTDCNINTTALDVLNYIAYATFIIFTLAVIYRLFIFGPLRLLSCCRADFELPQDTYIVPAQRVLTMLLLTALAGFAQYSIFCFTRGFPHSSWGSAVMFWLFHIFLYTYTWYRGTTIVIGTMQVIRNIRSDMEAISTRVKALGLTLNLLVGVSHTITIFGTVASNSIQYKYGFFVAYFVIGSAYQLCWLIVVVKYYSSFINTMQEHIEHAQRLGTGEQQNQQLIDSLDKMTRLRRGFGATVGIQTIFQIICIVLPPIGSYFIPIWQTTGMLALTNFLRELKPPSIHGDPTHATGSGTESGGTLTRSSTAHTSGSSAASTSYLLDKSRDAN